MSERFNIQRAIELMRALQVGEGDRADLVASVVRATLESADVDVEGLIEEASERQRGLQHEIDELTGEVAALEQSLEARRVRLRGRERDRDETASVQRKLERALDRAALRANLPPPAQQVRGLSAVNDGGGRRHAASDRPLRRA
jgi:chromosome segregation ATPase